MSKPSTPAKSGSGWILVAGLVIIGIAAALTFWPRGNTSAPVSAAAQGPASESTNASPASAVTPPEFEKLKGRWLRPDGGYVLEIRSVDPSGVMEAAYLNPRSIHVSKAVALREGQTVKVFVELRDVNYPGSTYTLAYDAGSDQLQGIYFQAVQRQNFEVYFERMKSP